MHLARVLGMDGCAGTFCNMAHTARNTRYIAGERSEYSHPMVSTFSNNVNVRWLSKVDNVFKTEVTLEVVLWLGMGDDHAIHATIHRVFVLSNVQIQKSSDHRHYLPSSGLP